MNAAHRAGPFTLISSAQNLTDSWVDLGFEIECISYNTLAVWIELDINLSSNARIRAIAKHASGGANEYVLPIKTVSATDIKVDAEYTEFNTDADQSMVLSVELANVVPFVQFQIQAGTVGGTAAQIDSAYVTLGY